MQGIGSSKINKEEKQNKDNFNMNNSSGANTTQSASNKPSSKFQNDVYTVPSLSLPKGGGAIRSIGEEFSVNAVNGTGSLKVPVFTSKGRSGFDPKLSLNYDSGSGNGPFGLGWSVSIPSITRITDKGLPRYNERGTVNDDGDEDIFILSGAEDLVPVLDNNNNRLIDTTTVEDYEIHFYRPRTEGLFARIECWVNLETGQQHWRSISKDNITTLYGKTEESRIYDPNNSNKIYSWSICESFDDKGNAILYKYKREDTEGINVNAINEYNRSGRSANIYLKKIFYSRKTPYFPYENENDSLDEDDFLFELVFDYGENYYVDIIINTEGGSSSIVARHENAENGLNPWLVRQDQFSSYRSCFEMRTSRLCRSVKMIHHFPEELGFTGNNGELISVEDYVVASTDFVYEENPTSSFLVSITHSSYVLRHEDSGNTYLKKSLPPLEFEYSKSRYENVIHTINDEYLENLPSGIDTNKSYQWSDLDGEGLSGVLIKQAGEWFYKRNISSSDQSHLFSTTSNNGDDSVDGDNGVNASYNNDKTEARFAPIEKVRWIPSIVGREGVGSNIGRFQLMDLAGDGKLDLVQFETTGSASGIYERTYEENWDKFIPFRLNPNVRWDDPNLRFIDLTGDGLADILITSHQAFTFYKLVGEEGYEYAKTIAQSLDEEKGPRVIFADSNQSIYLADMSGDGLTDIVRIQNGEVCYWPNLGYCKFGNKVIMDNSPWFDNPDYFSNQRIRLADVDGSGLTDIVYLARDRILIYLNRSGNGWSSPQVIDNFPIVDNLSSVSVLDLLGIGTSCLVWSSPLPRNARRNIRYVELTGGVKPHILVSVKNNMGAETKIKYAPSTKFYIRDKLEGKPWITKLPFVVHVVERVDVYDHISKNKFITQYSYHHGFFDGVERSFNGFGMVEQKDTLEFDVFKDAVDDVNVADSSITNLDKSSHVPPLVTKTWYHTGAYIRGKHIEKMFAEKEYYPYYNSSKEELGLNDEQLQKFDARLLDDTVIPFSLTAKEEREACRALKGSVLRTEVYAEDSLQGKSLNPYVVSEHNYSIKKLQSIAGGNRNGVFLVMPRETVTYNYERNPRDPRTLHNLTIDVDEFGNVRKAVSIAYGRDPEYVDSPDYTGPELSDQVKDKQKQILSTYTENNYTKLSVLQNALGEQEYAYIDLLKLQVLQNVYRTPVLCETKEYKLVGLALDDDNNAPGNLENNGMRFDFGSVRDALMVEEGSTIEKKLIENKRTLYRKDDLSDSYDLGVSGSLNLSYQSYFLAFTPELIDEVYGDKVIDSMLSDEGGYLQFEVDNNSEYAGWWWIPSGKIFYSLDPSHTPEQESNVAKQHFYLPHRFEDQFNISTFMQYDEYSFLLRETRDILENITRATIIDYRVLQPSLITDPNGNRSQVAFDVLGFVTGTAVMGKEGEIKGDSLEGFDPNMGAIDPLAEPHTLLLGATSRMMYDLFRFKNSVQYQDEIAQPNVISTILRETHESDLLQGQQTEVQYTFSYFDGFGREIQKKIQTKPIEPGDPEQDEGWIGSGWTIFNNKGKLIKKYEPFFDIYHFFKYKKTEGFSPTIFYDPVGRVIGTLYPNNTFEKTLYSNWFQTSWDLNDTVSESDPRDDAILGDHFRRLFPDPDDYESWFDARINGQMDTTGNPLEEQHATQKAILHDNSPSISYLDSLGRGFVVVADNKDAGKYSTQTELDIKGNLLSVTDPKGRKVVLYNYDLSGTQMRELSMDAGVRWILNDVLGNPIYQWDSRGFRRRLTYDILRRPQQLSVRDANGNEFLAEETIYGESKTDSTATNHRMKVWQVKDNAGIVFNDEFDFKGNLVRNSRTLLADFRSQVNWNSETQSELEDESFTSSTIYDALNKSIQVIEPHSNRPNSRINVLQYSYNKANSLEQINAWLNHVDEPAQLLNPSTATHNFVRDVKYNAKGQRKHIIYGNGIITSYRYDEFTFRLINLVTKRGNEDLQNLSYFYDPVGNITSIQDNSQQTIFFNGQIIEPHTEYVYDPIYRLIEARGREHMGSASQPHTTWRDEFRISQTHPNDGQKMRNYSESYEYDEVGNILRVVHNTVDGNWIREYLYNGLSITEPGINNNRLSETIIHPNATTPINERYVYDNGNNGEHGNMTTMQPHLSRITYNFKDEMISVNLGGGGDAFYIYGQDGQRVRKVHDHIGSLVEDRIYIGDFEIYRRNNANGLVLERETLHIMVNGKRIVTLDTRTVGEDECTEQSIRYQFDNHLGSSSLELNEDGNIISYEEYYPYGSTSYQAGINICELNSKRYRYIGKERDEETGLNYHGARYYALWLGIWISCDPLIKNQALKTSKIELIDILKAPYKYSYNNPIIIVDYSGFDGEVIEDEGPKKTNSQESTNVGDVLSKGFSDVVDEAKKNPSLTKLPGDFWKSLDKPTKASISSLGIAGYVLLLNLNKPELVNLALPLSSHKWSPLKSFKVLDVEDPKFEIETSLDNPLNQLMSHSNHPLDSPPKFGAGYSLTPTFSAKMQFQPNGKYKLNFSYGGGFQRHVYQGTMKFSLTHALEYDTTNAAKKDEIPQLSQNLKASFRYKSNASGLTFSAELGLGLNTKFNSQQSIFYRNQDNSLVEVRRTLPAHEFTSGTQQDNSSKMDLSFKLGINLKW